MARAETIIIDVKINAEETAQKLGEVSKSISELKQKNADIRKDIKSGNTTWAEGTKAIKENENQIKQLQAAEKTLSGQLAITTAANRKYGDSNNELRAQVADLERQYNSLSKEQKKTDAGKALLKQQQELKASVKANAEELGNFQDSVGNYFGKFGQNLQSINNFTKANGGLADSFKAGGQAVSGFGKQLLSLLANPIVAIIASIALVVMKLVDAFKKNDEASTNLERAFSSLQPITTFIGKIFEGLAVTISKIAVGFGKVIRAILSLIPGYKGAAEAADALVVSQDKLEETERQYTVNSAKRNAEIARIKKEAVNTQKYTSKQIEDMLKRADDLEQQNLEDYKAMKAEKVRILEAESKKNNDTSDEMMNKIASATAEMYNAEESYYSGTLRLATKTNAVIEKQIEERNRRREEELKKEKEKNDAIIKSNQNVAETLYKIGKREEQNAIDNIQNVKRAFIENPPANITGDMIEKYKSDLSSAEEYIKNSQMDNFDFKMQLLTDEYNASLDNAQKLGYDTFEIEQAYSEKKKKLIEEETNAKLSATSQILGNLSEVFGKQTELGKAAAAAQIAIDTYQAAMAAYKALVGLGPAGPVLAVAAAGAATLRGAKAIKDVYAVDSKFADGGIVQGTSFTGDNLIARVNSGEMIFNTEQQKKLFRMIAYGNNFSGGMDYELLAKAISKQPAPVLVYKEFGDFQRKISTFDEQVKI